MALLCSTCPSLESRFLHGQASDTVEGFSKLVTRNCIYGKGKTIVNQGEEINRIYFVCAGLVKLTRFSEGSGEVILDILGPCSIIGGVNPQQKCNANYWSAETVTAITEVAYLKTDDLFRLFRHYPEFGIGFSYHLSARLRAAHGMIADMKAPVEKRLLAVLSRVMEILHGNGDHRLLEFPFSHRMLAQFAQITPETLSRTLSALQKKNIIKLENRGIRILQVKPFQEAYPECCGGWGDEQTAMPIKVGKMIKAHR